jgi:hypothetical protein
MGTRDDRNQASIHLGPLIALVVVALAVAIYFWKFAPVERQLSAEITDFEVRSEADPTKVFPVLDSLAATVTFANRGDAVERISKARFLVSNREDLSEPRSWSPTLHRDSMLRDLKLAPGESITHTFIIPWTGREEARYFPDGAPVHLGFSVVSLTPGGEPATLTKRFGQVIPQRGRIADSNHELLVLEFPKG